MITSGFLVLALSLSQVAPARSGAVKPSKVPIDPETGAEVQCDLPDRFHLRNITGRNGQGCCVYASGEMMARYFGFVQLEGILAEGLGGASARDVEAMFRRRAPGFHGYAQATGRDSVPFLDWCMRSNRLACVTYGKAHMVCLLHLDPPDAKSPRACVLDNNQPRTWIWMSRDEFIQRHQVGGAWSYALIIPAPPPIPVSPRK